MSPLPCGRQATLCDPIRHVNSRSGEACCELLYPVTLFFTSRLLTTTVLQVARRNVPCEPRKTWPFHSQSVSQSARSATTRWQQWTRRRRRRQGRGCTSFITTTVQTTDDRRRNVADEAIHRWRVRWLLAGQVCRTVSARGTASPRLALLAEKSDQDVHREPTDRGPTDWTFWRQGRQGRPGGVPPTSSES